MLVRVGLGASLFARLPSVFLEQRVPCQRYTVDALNLLEIAQDALQENHRIKKIGEVVRSLGQCSASEGVADTDKPLPGQARKVEVKCARGLDWCRGLCGRHEAANELKNVTSKIVAINASIAELERRRTVKLSVDDSGHAVAKSVNHPNLLDVVRLSSQKFIHDRNVALFRKAETVSKDEDLGVRVPRRTLRDKTLHDQDTALAHLLGVSTASYKRGVEPWSGLNFDRDKVASINSASILRKNLVGSGQQLRERLSASERRRVGGAGIGDGHGEAAAVEVGTVCRASRVLRSRGVDLEAVKTLSSKERGLEVDGSEAGAEASVDLLRACMVLLSRGGETRNGLTGRTSSE